jgi:hypothetical protein
LPVALLLGSIDSRMERILPRNLSTEKTFDLSIVRAASENPFFTVYGA